MKKYVGDEKNRSVRFQKHIYFDSFTKIVAETENLTKIPAFSFDLFDFEDVDRSVADVRYLIGINSKKTIYFVVIFALPGLNEHLIHLYFRCGWLFTGHQS